MIYYGQASRFCIRVHRSRDGDAAFMVHDSDWITDAEAREGHSSPVVSQHTSLEAAKKWCEDVESGKERSVPHPSSYEGWPELKQRVVEHEMVRKTT